MRPNLADMQEIDFVADDVVTTNYSVLRIIQYREIHNSS